jgi:hypothetical protein
MKKIILSILLMFLAFTLTKAQPAVAGAHFTSGGSGYMLASMPPPGLYYLMYNVWFQSDDYYDNDGHKMRGADFKTRVFSQTHRFVYSTPVQILGGNLMFDLLIPISYNHYGDGLVGGMDNRKFGLNDISSHTTIAWHGARYDALASMCIFFPIGEYHQDEPTSPGKGYWGLQPTAGLTLYFDEAKTWTWSTVLRYEISYRQRGTDVTEGNFFHMESALGKQLGNMSLAVSTAGSWQTTDAKGKGPVVNPWRSERFALGPDVGVNLPGSWGNLNLRCLFDVTARYNPKGVMTVLTWTKVIF